MIANNDTDLVQECLIGNTKEFEALIDKYQKKIFNIVYRMTDNYDDAEDITQSVFIKVYEKLNSFNPKFKFFSWLYRIALNESLNLMNQKKRLAELDADFITQGKSPEEIYDELELSERIQDALMEIELEHRVLIVLKHFEGFSYQEMAFMLDISEQKVKSRLFSARQVLKNVLINRGIVGHD
ncbi:MAG: sigma-70 family RNA polymerase sigma factor [bacterium]|jgi:RNA polymerase sigma-70 factor (ECF subfamily)|nr:sigma-70 family RNA polymerase sigma factor [bacterium]